MIKNFSDILTGGPTLEQLEERHRDAQTKLEAAEAEYSAAALAAEDGDASAAKQRDKAARDADKARARVQELAAAITAARARDAAREADQVRVDLAGRWEATEKAMAERLKAAEDIQAAVATLGAAWQRLEHTSEDVRRLSPIQVYELDETHQRGVLLSLLKFNIAAAGPLEFGVWPGPPDKTPRLVDRVRDGNKHVLWVRDNPPQPLPVAEEETTEAEEA